ncbi:PTS sugar transporter subunit IIC, partial [Acinetobacter baumannii]
GATNLQPIVMGIVLAMLFAFMIVSPVSTVGLATAIFMEGISAGTANLGVVAAGFGLLVAGWRVNGFATSILHVLGSPKVQMANMFS